MECNRIDICTCIYPCYKQKGYNCRLTNKDRKYKCVDNFKGNRTGRGNMITKGNYYHLDIHNFIAVVYKNNKGKNDYFHFTCFDYEDHITEERKG